MPQLLIFLVLHILLCLQMFIRLLFHTRLIFVEIGEDWEQRGGWSTDSIPDTSRQTETSVDLRRAPTVIHTSGHRCFWDEGRWGWRWEDNGRAGGKKLIYSCYSYQHIGWHWGTLTHSRLVCYSVNGQESIFLLCQNFNTADLVIMCCSFSSKPKYVNALIHTHQHGRRFREPQWDWGSLLRSLLTVLTGQASGSATLCGER